MQIKPEQLLRQQMILRFLGYYKHKLDGIWGPACIEAKKAFERHRDFAPAFPNNGLPFADKDTYPKGIGYDRATRLLTCNGLSETVIAEYNELMANLNKTPTLVVAEPVPKENLTPPPNESVEVPQESTSVESPVPTQIETAVENKNNHNHNKHHNHNRR